MNTILIATDFSPASDNAMYYGAQLANDLGSAVVLTHIYQVQVSMTDMPVMMFTVEELKKNSDQKGVEYDKNYLSDVISKHEKSIAMYEKAADKSEDADVRKLFSNALPELRNHLDMAMNTKNKLK